MMILHRLLILVAILLGAGLTGCQTSRVHTGIANADVFVDGEYIGTGKSVKIDRYGSNDEVEIRVTSGGKEAVLTVDRQFTFVTFIGTVYTYFIGYFFFWELPADIYASYAIDEPTVRSKNPWQESPWRKQSPWQKKKNEQEPDEKDPTADL